MVRAPTAYDAIDRTCAPVSTRQTRVVPSPDPVHSSCVRPLNARPDTPLGCSSSRPLGSNDGTFQIWTAAAWLLDDTATVAARVPSGLNATRLTLPRCGRTAEAGSPVTAFQKRAPFSNPEIGRAHV